MKETLIFLIKNSSDWELKQIAFKVEEDYIRIWSISHYEFHNAGLIPIFMSISGVGTYIEVFNNKCTLNVYW